MRGEREAAPACLRASLRLPAPPCASLPSLRSLRLSLPCAVTDSTQIPLALLSGSRGAEAELRKPANKVLATRYFITFFMLAMSFSYGLHSHVWALAGIPW